MASTASSGRPERASTPANSQVATQEDRTTALEFLRSLAAEVSGGTVNLPCFPDVVIRIRKALADPEARLTQTVKIVGAEPRLAARLLQAANSAAFNHSGKPLTDLRAAITRLGHRAVQSSAMAFAVQQLSELKLVAGIEVVGPIPRELQTPAVFSAGRLTASARPAICERLARIPCIRITTPFPGCPAISQPWIVAPLELENWTP